MREKNQRPDSNNSARQKAFQETYRIEEKLGSGSGGTVYKAYHKHLQKEVVLKKLHENAATFLNKRTEADALKNIRHSYIPQVLDYIELEDGIYTVMDYVPGTTFKNLLNEGRTFSQGEVLVYARQLFEALSYIHGKTPPIIHGDIKPENLMLTPDGNICLIDFNISGYVEGAGALIGGYTNGYAAPEQVEEFRRLQRMIQASMQSPVVSPGNDATEILPSNEELHPVFSDFHSEGRVSARADIYSAGATLYHILTGALPTYKDYKVLPPKYIKPNISDGMNYILCKCLEWDPDNRFPSAVSVREALDNIQTLEGEYRSFRARRFIQIGLSLTLMITGLVLSIAGKKLIQAEYHEEYRSAIRQMQEINNSVSYANSNDTIREEFEK